MSSEPKPDVAANNPAAGEEADDQMIGRALRRSLLVIVAVAVLIAGGLAFFNRRPPQAAPRDAEFALPKVRQQSVATPPVAHLVDITKQAGIDFVHTSGAYGEKLLPETMGSGCAFFDYDNDGHQDLLLVNSTHWPWRDESKSEQPTMALYHNDGHGKFNDVTDEAGLAHSFHGTGVAVGDFDNDGHVDVFVSAVGGNHLYRNQGGKFADVTETAGVAGDADTWSTSCGWFDFDNDGDLDLMVCNYVKWTKEIDLAQKFSLRGGGRAYGPPMSFEGTFPNLYRNDGDGKFTDVSAAAGIQIKNPATGVPMAKSLGIAPIDLDGDSWMDVVIANDTVQNFVFRNLRDGTFEEVGALAGMAFDSFGNARGAMGIDAARFRNNETLGVAIGNFANEMSSLFVSQGSPLQFADEAIATGFGPPSRQALTFGLFFFDYDLDSRLDVLAANGHLEEDINTVQASQHYEQPPQLFWNCGRDLPTEFLLVPESKTGPDFVQPMVGRGAAYADIDSDGDLDIVITATGGPPRLLRNDQQTGHHWLRLKLVGTTSNRDAIGAWVEATVGDQVLRRQVMATRSYQSQCELPVTLGLGTADKIDKLVVRWPDGSRQQIDDIKLGTLQVIEQPTAAPTGSE